ncbi:MAG: response regulator transcription factor [Desulfobacterales bacterium]
MADKIAIMIVDDHPLFREGLKSIIGRDQRYEIVDEAGSGQSALGKAEKIKPDLMMVDLSLPDMSGIQLTRKILAKLPQIKIIIVTMHSKVDYMAEAFQAGATGFVVKESAAEGLLKGIETVLKGNYFLDSAVSTQVVETLKKLPGKETKINDAVYGTLTAREQEILRLLAEGLSAKDIARKLFISPKTVENHRANLMNKLNLHSTIELVRYAAKLGLIDVDLWTN